MYTPMSKSELRKCTKDLKARNFNRNDRRNKIFVISFFAIQESISAFDLHERAMKIHEQRSEAKNLIFRVIAKAIGPNTSMLQ